jgi:periplasmic protein TonB
LHVVVLWALMNGLNIHPLAAHSGDMTVRMIDQAPPPVEKPPIPEAHPTELNFRVDKLEPVPVTPIDIDIDAPPPPTVVTVREPVQGAAGSAEPKPVITGAAVDPRHPLSQPPYPMEARHFGEEGRLVLAILVGADGRVLDAKATQSSGSERLDQAAIKEARQHWRLRPAMRNGVAFEQWLTVPVVFRLENR